MRSRLGQVLYAKSHRNRMKNRICKQIDNSTTQLRSFKINLTLHSQKWSISNFSYSLTRNITSHSMKNLAFHSLLRWKMNYTPEPILTTSLIHFSLGRLGECTFWTWQWKCLTSTVSQFSHCEYDKLSQSLWRDFYCQALCEDHVKLGHQAALGKIHRSSILGSNNDAGSKNYH